MLRDGELTTPGPRLGPTLDLSPGAGPPPGDAAREPTPRLCGHRGMVEGSAANLQGQTRLLLLGRLRASAAVIFFGMGVMLLWAFVYSEAPLAQDGLQLAVHSSAVLIEGGVVLLLLRFPCLTLRALRVVELVVFGVPAARFLAMGPLVAEALVKINGELTGLLSEADLLMLAEDMENNTTDVAMLVEHLWPTRFAQAVRKANGELVTSVRIPHGVIEAARQSLLDAAKRAR